MGLAKTIAVAAAVLCVTSWANAQGEPPPPPPDDEPAPEPEADEAPPPDPEGPAPAPPPPPPGYGQQPAYGQPAYGQPPPAYGQPPPAYGQPPPGQPYAPYPYPPPGGPAYYEPPPPPAPPNTGAELHDGFYLRFGLGFGTVGATVSYAPENAFAEKSISGFGAGFHLMIGGSPADGLAIGFALLGMAAGEAEEETEAEGVPVTREVPLNLSIGGLFVDGFPDPKGGFNVGGTVGIAAVSTTDDNADYNVKTGGLGGAAWLGYTAWVGEEWSVGALLWLAGASTSADRSTDVEGIEVSFEEEAVARSVILSFTALYH
jgi:hypothetical protein